MNIKLQPPYRSGIIDVVTSNDHGNEQNLSWEELKLAGVFAVREQADLILTESIAPSERENRVVRPLFGHKSTLQAIYREYEAQSKYSGLGKMHLTLYIVSEASQTEIMFDDHFEDKVYIFNDLLSGLDVDLCYDENDGVEAVVITDSDEPEAHFAVYLDTVDRNQIMIEVKHGEEWIVEDQPADANTQLFIFGLVKQLLDSKDVFVTSD